MNLTDQQVQTFREEGVLAAEGVVTDADLLPVIREYEDWVERRARTLQAEGKITDLREGQPFERRFACLYAQSPEIEKGMDIAQTRGPAMFAFLHNAHLLDAVERLIGPEITCNPIQHVRAKPPAAASGGGAGFYNVPWHQDAGVTWEEADASEIVTCWLPLVDATVSNGCMEVIPGVWRQGYREHQAEGGTTIRPDLLPTETPTGRPFHPDFIARSRRDPASVLTDHAAWMSKLGRGIGTIAGRFRTSRTLEQRRPIRKDPQHPAGRGRRPGRDERPAPAGNATRSRRTTSMSLGTSSSPSRSSTSLRRGRRSTNIGCRANFLKTLQFS